MSPLRARAPTDAVPPRLMSHLVQQESGDAFCKAAEMALKGEEKDDAANDFWTASKSYKKTNPERKHPDAQPQPPPTRTPARSVYSNCACPFQWLLLHFSVRSSFTRRRVVSGRLRTGRRRLRLSFSRRVATSRERSTRSSRQATCTQARTQQRKSLCRSIIHCSSQAELLAWLIEPPMGATRRLPS